MYLVLYQYTEFAYKHLRNFELPSWNPYIFCGQPLIASNQSGAFYPINFLFYLLFPNNSDYYTFTIIFHFTLLFIGCYALMRTLQILKTAAVFGAMSYAFSAFMTAHHFNIAIISSRAWFPIVICLFIKFIKSYKFKYLILTVIVIVIQLLVGHPQPVFIEIVYLFLFIFLLSFFKENKIQFFLKSNAALTFAIILAIIITLPQFKTTWEYSRQTSRVESGKFDYITMRSLPPWQLLTFIYPDIFGSPAENSYFSSEGFDEFNAYISIISLTFAAIAVRLLFRKSYLVKIFAIISIIGILIGLGRYTPVFRILYLLPGFNIFRAPARYLNIYVLSISILSAFGFEYLFLAARAQSNELISNIRQKLKIIKFVILFIVLFFLGLSITVLFFDRQTENFINIELNKARTTANHFLNKFLKHQNRVTIDYYSYKIKRIIFTYQKTAPIMAAFAFICFYLIFVKILTNKSNASAINKSLQQINFYRKNIFFVNAFLLLFAELYFFGSRAIPYIDRSFFDSKPELIKFLRSKEPNLFGDTNVKLLDNSPNLYRVFVWNRGLMYQPFKNYAGYLYDQKPFYRILDFCAENIPMQFRLRSFWGYDTLVSARLNNFRTAILKGKLKLLDIAAIKYIITCAALPQLTVYEKINDILIYKNDNALPIFYCVNNILVKKENEVLDIISADTFDVKNTVVLEIEDNDENFYGSENKNISKENENIDKNNYIQFQKTIIKILEYRDNYYSLEIENPNKTPTFLVVVDSFDTNWRAYLNKNTVKIYRANYVFKSVKIPHGKHLVELKHSFFKFN